MWPEIMVQKRCHYIFMIVFTFRSSQKCLLLKKKKFCTHVILFWFQNLQYLSQRGLSKCPYTREDSKKVAVVVLQEEYD